MAGTYVDLVGAPPLPTTLAFRAWEAALVAARQAECPIVRTATRYIDPVGGSDSNDGLTTGAPWQHLHKINDHLATITSDVAYLIKRGTVVTYHATTDPALEINKDQITIGAYGTGANPVFSKFDHRWTNSGWTQHETSTNCWSLTEATAMGWIRIYGEDPAAFTVFHRCTSLALLNGMGSNHKGFFQDGTTLYVNVGGDPGLLDLEGATADATSVSAIHVTGDLCRVDSVRCDGYGFNTSWAGGNSYPIYFQPGEAKRCVVSNCQAYYGAWHMIGMAGAGGGAAFTVVNCDAGLCQDTGASVFVGYQADGGFEYITHNCTVRYGTLPVEPADNAFWYPAGMENHSHADPDHYAALVIQWGMKTLDGPYGCRSPFSPSSPPLVTTLVDARGFVFDCEFTNSYGRTLSGGPFGRWGIVAANNRFTYTVLAASAGETGVIVFGAAGYSWAWNNTININAAPGAVNVSIWRTAFAAHFVAIHNHIQIAGANSKITRIEYTGSATYLANFRWANNIFAAIPGTGASTYTQLSATRNDNADNLKANAYFGWDAAYKSSTAGYSIDAAMVEPAAIPVLGHRPASANPLYQAGTVTPLGLDLEYDQNWRIRDLASPTIGPLEPLGRRTTRNLQALAAAGILQT